MKRKDLYVISKATFGEYAVHDIQSNSSWAENPYGDEYAVIPPEMAEDITATCGYCDIELNKYGTEVVSFKAREIPIMEEPEQPVSEAEQLRADLDYLAIMTGVTL